MKIPKNEIFLFYVADWHFFINVLYFYTPTSTVIQIGFFLILTAIYCIINPIMQ